PSASRSASAPSCPPNSPSASAAPPPSPSTPPTTTGSTPLADSGKSSWRGLIFSIESRWSPDFSRLGLESPLQPAKAGTPPPHENFPSHGTLFLPTFAHPLCPLPFKSQLLSRRRLASPSTPHWANTHGDALTHLLRRTASLTRQ